MNHLYQAPSMAVDYCMDDILSTSIVYDPLVFEDGAGFGDSVDFAG